MAMDIRLVQANEELSNIAFEKGCDSEEYKAARLDWLEVFKAVAEERGEPVIAWENPYDAIMDFIHLSPDPERIEHALAEFKQMIDALASIEYINLGEWRANYYECLAAFAATRKE